MNNLFALLLAASGGACLGYALASVMAIGRIADLQKENNELRIALLAWGMWSEGDAS